MAKRKIVLITGNQLNYESGILENYIEHLKEDAEKIKKIISNLFISQFYKFPNYNHVKILEFIQKYQNEIIHYDQSFLNFWENLNYYNSRKLEGNINQIKCLKCNRIYSIKKIGNKKECPKCKSNLLINNLLFKNSSVTQYKVLLEDIGFKTMKNLFFQIKTEQGEVEKNNSKDKNNIWNIDFRNDINYFIIVIGYNEEIIELTTYFKDALKLRPENYKIFSLNLYDNEEDKFSYSEKTELLSNNIDKFLEKLEIELNT